MRGFCAGGSSQVGNPVVSPSPVGGPPGDIGPHPNVPHHPHSYQEYPPSPASWLSDVDSNANNPQYWPSTSASSLQRSTGIRVSVLRKSQSAKSKRRKWANPISKYWPNQTYATPITSTHSPPRRWRRRHHVNPNLSSTLSYRRLCVSSIKLHNQSHNNINTIQNLYYTIIKLHIIRAWLTYTDKCIHM